MRHSISLVVFHLLLGATCVFAQKTSFVEESKALKPNYSLEESWSALPFRTDAADVVVKGEKWVEDSLKKVDVFYVHPTIYQKGPLWNASLEMTKLNRKVDKYPVRLQGSVFNESCRVFAPRYRQAVVKVFYDRTEDGNAALNFAYQDVKRAFEYYLEHYNNGRPFIIAGHSQGTYHTRRLLQEVIDTLPIRERMVAAYVIGFAVNDTMYHKIKICQDSTDTGCYVSWMSYKQGFEPSGWWFENAQSVNPITWTTDTTKVSLHDYTGTIVLNTNRKFSRPMSVQIKELDGKILWVRTKAPWLRMMKNLHVADYGLFYRSIRKNVKTRIESFLSEPH